MSSNRARNFRRRAGDDDEDDGATGGDAVSATNLVKVPSKPSSISGAKPKKPQAPKLLSFADDEDSETPSRSKRSISEKSTSRLGKQSSSSHKMTALKDRIAHSSSATASVPSNVQPQAGTYTKEALRELQKNTRTLASSSRPSSDSKPSSEPIIVLKGLVKPMEPVKEVPKSDSEDEQDELKEKKDDFFHTVKDDAQDKLASIGLTNGKSSSGSLFPDEETIKAIRAKRERLRQARPAAPDYISLDGGSNHGAAEGLSDEEPEFQGRIAMFGKKMEGGKKGVFEDVDERTMNIRVKDIGELDDNDDDEEEKMWEEEQFRKGLGKRMDEGSNARAGSSDVPVTQGAQQQKFASAATTVYSAASSASVSPSIGGAIGTSLGLDVMSLSQQAEIAKKALQDNVRRLKESHGRTVSSLNKTDENLSSSLLNITALENSLAAADEKYRFMQKLRSYVANICDFLQHKAPYIEELEEQMKGIHGDRASAIFERRNTNNDDEMKGVEAAVKAAMSVFNRKGSNTEVIAAAASAAQAASTAAREQKDLPVKLDEFGRDLNLEKRMKMKAQEEERQRRKLRALKSNKQAYMEIDYQKIEGESSTDESDSESQAYQSQRDLLLQTADQIFSDAAEEYGQLSLVKKRFEEWKKEYSSSYRDAYMSLSLPSIFSPYVRLELLKWDPLRKGSDFQEMKWYKLLFTYGLPEDAKGLVHDDDDVDLELVPNLVEKVALPILQYEIANCWDMLSHQETVNAITATKLIVQHVSHESEALADLLVSIRTRLADAVANITVPTWGPLVLAAVPDAARVAAYRFGVSVRLLRNICLWKDVFAMPVLEKLALEELLFGKVLPHFRSISENVHDAIMRTERIIASLSGVWAGPSVVGDKSRKLQPLVDYVLSLGRILEKRNVGGVVEGDTSQLARRLKKILVDLNEYDNARNIARTFRLKEAL
ncbi:transcriptional repressor ILP1 [Neltuma alba]|uniref:transcriptional repressor ILP1 n=1 Tax=Neltuma alba TaxID=207710 RepID=UPI0010A32A61|nr:transcriptional repressor ILP1 [Prosopis alba]XP_028776368.1 transcriptional repressor ILP1 [Prosopis alba]